MERLPDILNGYFATSGTCGEIWAINTTLDIFKDEDLFEKIYTQSLFGRLKHKIHGIKLLLSDENYDDLVRAIRDDKSDVFKNLVELQKQRGNRCLNKIWVGKKSEVPDNAIRNMKEGVLFGFYANQGKVFNNSSLLFWRDSGLQPSANGSISDVFRAPLVATIPQDGDDSQKLRRSAQRAFKQYGSLGSARSVAQIVAKRKREVRYAKYRTDVKVLVVVALKFEEEVVRKILEERLLDGEILECVSDASGKYLYETTVKSRTSKKDYCYHLFVIRSENMGNVASSVAVSAALRDIDADWIVLLGIAGAMKTRDLRIGSVIVCDDCIAYDYGKLKEPSQTDLKAAPNEHCVGVDGKLECIKRCHFESRASEHRARIDHVLKKEFVENFKARIHFDGKKPLVTAVLGRYYSGSKVVACDGFFGSSREAARKRPAAVEMEAHGVFEVGQFYDRRVLVIKGVSDWADGDKGGGDDIYNRKLAASSSAALLKEVLFAGQLPPRK